MVTGRGKLGQFVPELEHLQVAYRMRNPNPKSTRLGTSPTRFSRVSRGKQDKGKADKERNLNERGVFDGEEKQNGACARIAILVCGCYGCMLFASKGWRLEGQRY